MSEQSCDDHIRKLSAKAAESCCGLYLKYYKCSKCGTEWKDKHDCLCDDRCPKCNTSMQPYDYEEVTIGDG